VSLQHLPADAPPTDVAAAIARDGAAIVDRVADPDLVGRILDETRPHLEATAVGADDFSGRRTRRTGSLVARSPGARELVAHPLVLGVCEEVLGPHATSYQLHLTQIIDIGPGEPSQPLHRDQWAWDFFPFPEGVEVELSTIWAMQDFTEANGATRVVPGSHRWPADRRPGPDESVPAEMEAGSVLLYTGSAWHGGGANTTERSRTAVNIDYCLGWLRQEENQYLSCPPEVARELPLPLARLIGYSRAAFALGYFGDTQDPIEALHPDQGSPGFAVTDP
jgi:ectoine hydroxylase-related dioxygenase (phytanoyl-CoA dioxygenase family)